MEELDRNDFHFTKRHISFLYVLKDYLSKLGLQFNSSYQNLFRKTYLYDDYIFIDKETNKMYKLDYTKYDIYKNGYHSHPRVEKLPTIIRKVDLGELIQKNKRVNIHNVDRDDAEF